MLHSNRVVEWHTRRQVARNFRCFPGLEPQSIVEQAELYGLLRSRAVVDPGGKVRITLNASEGRNSMMACALSTFAGPGVHHIALTYLAAQARSLLEPVA